MKKHQVIVIGGGISGLTACATLKANGLNDFILLEATDHLGGRIKSLPLGTKLFLGFSKFLNKYLFNF